MYKVINLKTGKIFHGGLTKGDTLHNCLNELLKKLGLNTTAKQAYDAGYRIIRA